MEAVLPNRHLFARVTHFRKRASRSKPLKSPTRAKKLKNGDELVAINSNGYVPALRLGDGEILTGNVAVLQYISDPKPETPLAPPTRTTERYRPIELLAYINSELHNNFGPQFNASTTRTSSTSRAATSRSS